MFKKYYLRFDWTENKFFVTDVKPLYDEKYIDKSSSKEELNKKCNKLNNFLFYYKQNIPVIKDFKPGVYVLTGEYPRLAIKPVIVETEDEFNYCVRNEDSNTIEIYPQDRCFESYEEANDKLIEKIQKATSLKNSLEKKNGVFYINENTELVGE